MTLPDSYKEVERLKEKIAEKDFYIEVLAGVIKLYEGLLLDVAEQAQRAEEELAEIKGDEIV